MWIVIHDVRREDHVDKLSLISILLCSSNYKIILDVFAG